MSPKSDSRTPVDHLLDPNSIAIVGASPREESVGFRVMRNLRLMGFPGPIYPVNPRYPEVSGLRCYPSLSELPTPVDATFLGVPGAQITALVDEAGRNGIRAAFINAVGFADAGPEGVERQRELVRVADGHGVALSGPNNTGLVNVQNGKAIWTFRYMTPIAKGPVAVISQSGSIALVLSEDERKLGLSYVVTCGNEANVTAADYLDRIVRDDRVSVILLYLETIRKPEAFARAAEEAARSGKHIVVLKVGSSEVGRQMVAAHTGSLAGDDRVYDAFFRRLGIIRVGDLDEMIETSVLLTSHRKPPRTRHVLPVTLSGGEASLLADIGTELGLSTPNLAPDTVKRLQPGFPPFATPRNPLDAWGLAFNRERFIEILDAVTEDPQFGTIAFAVDAPAKGGGDVPYIKMMAEVCAAAGAAKDRRLVFFNNSVGDGPNGEVREILDAAGLPYLSGMRTALQAIRHFAGLAERPRPAAANVPPAPAVDLDALDEAGRFELLAAAGLPMARSVAAETAEDAAAAAKQLGFPVALKGWVDGLSHKSDLGLVRLDLRNAAAVATAHAEVARLVKSHGKGARAGVVVQAMGGDGVELIVGVRNLPGFGSIIVVGPGGLLVNLIDRVALRIGPVSEAEAVAMLEETPAATLLRGVRGRGPFNVAAAARAIAALSRFGAATLGKIAAIEINPLIVLREGAIGVDVVLERQHPDNP